MMPFTGKTFTAIEVVSQGGTFPMFLACDDSKRFVYAAETPADDGDAPGFINACVSPVHTRSLHWDMYIISFSFHLLFFFLYEPYAQY